MALGVTDLKKGQIFQLEGVPYRVIEYTQKVMGRGGSIVNVKIKSLIDGRVLAKTFKGSESIAPADVSSRTVQYLYNDGAVYYFMDNVTYEQYELPASDVGEQGLYLRDGDPVSLQFFDGKVIGLELPKNVWLSVTEAEEAVRGDTANALQKEAQLETGLKVRVPAFIKVGDVISVDTSTGAYRERAKN